MEMTETVKNVLSKMIEAAGANGVSEGEVTRELAVRHGIGYYAALDSLRKVYKEVPGVERTPEHSGAVIFYKKTKQKKEPEESMAVRLAKKLGKRTMGEKERMEILNHYR